MFKEILQCSLALALVAAEKSSSGGFCLSSKQVALWCTAGTPLGDRLMDAFLSCSDTKEEGKEEEKSKGKGKGDRAGDDTMCPSFDVFEAWFMVHYKGKREFVISGCL